jgi:hypothetical protein
LSCAANRWATVVATAIAQSGVKFSMNLCLLIRDSGLF